MVSTIPLETSVTEILDKALAAGEPVPSIRAIRMKTGRGSLTTIANLVREWRINHLPPEPKPRTGFSDEQAEMAVNGLWQLVEPIINEQASGIRKHFTEQIAVLEDKATALQEENERLQARNQELEKAYNEAEAKAQQAHAERIAAETKAKETEAILAAKHELEIRVAALTAKIEAQEAQAKETEAVLDAKRNLEIQVAALQAQVEVLKELKKPTRSRTSKA